MKIIPIIIISTKSRWSWHLWAAMGKGTEGVVWERWTGGDVQHLNKDILIMTVISDHGQADHIEPKNIVAGTQWSIQIIRWFPVHNALNTCHQIMEWSRYKSHNNGTDASSPAVYCNAWQDTGKSCPRASCSCASWAARCCCSAARTSPTQSHPPPVESESESQKNLMIHWNKWKNVGIWQV